MPRLMRYFAILLVIGLAAFEAKAEKRVALVIGNSDYGNAIGFLKNPANDARLMAKSLRAVGFDVIERIDANEKKIKRAIRAFGKKLRSAGEDGVGLFYYAGHGVQVGGENYLIPIGAEIESEGDVEIEAVSANGVLAQMEYAGTRVNIVILDACRNTPVARGFRSASRGLARMRAPRGSYIAYATAPGDVTADGTGANSPFTTALAKAVTTKGIPLEQAFKQVRRDVQAATNMKQTPWTSSSLTGDFYFAGPPQASTQTAAPVTDKALELSFWKSIQDSTNPKSFEAYLATYPDGQFAALSRVKIEELTPRPAQPAVGTYLTPGKTFKDCADCPEMVVIPSGSFRMGDLAGDGYSREKPVHRVTIPRPFAVGKYEVTQAEWRAVMGSNPSRFKGDRNPVEMVSWDDAKDFVRKLSAKTGKTYRLLSEAEWEYAARAGTQSKYLCGNGDGCLSGVAWYPSNSGNGTHPVGSKGGNAFGLHDMHGNVWEWVEDCRHKSYAGAPTDGRHPSHHDRPGTPPVLPF